jgi:hypothetical protein
MELSKRRQSEPLEQPEVKELLTIFDDRLECRWEWAWWWQAWFLEYSRAWPGVIYYENGVEKVDPVLERVANLFRVLEAGTRALVKMERGERAPEAKAPCKWERVLGMSLVRVLQNLEPKLEIPGVELPTVDPPWTYKECEKLISKLSLKRRVVIDRGLVYEAHRVHDTSQKRVVKAFRRTQTFLKHFNPNVTVTEEQIREKLKTEPLFHDYFNVLLTMEGHIEFLKAHIGLANPSGARGAISIDGLVRHIRSRTAP